jgi:hypothetical protein
MFLFPHITAREIIHTFPHVSAREIIHTFFPHYCKGDNSHMFPILLQGKSFTNVSNITARETMFPILLQGR